jgi:hypothetical protein
MILELRIRNLVECFGTREVVAIKKNKIKVQHESKKGHFIIEWVPIDSLSLKPIPLTEEWLLKFGFERRPWGLIINGLLFRDNIKNPCEVLTLEIGNGFRTEVKYVHQLQNLYFSLTGEELIIKEN